MRDIKEREYLGRPQACNSLLNYNKLLFTIPRNLTYTYYFSCGYLHNKEHVIFSDSTDLTKIVRKERAGITKFKKCMETNKHYEEAR